MAGAIGGPAGLGGGLNPTSFFPSNLTFGAGTSATSALQSGLSSTATTGAKTAAGFGAMLPGIGTAFSLASFGLDLFNQFRPNPALEQQAYNQAYNREMQRFQIDERNRQRQEIFKRQLEMVSNQLDANSVAAWESWTSEQVRLNEVYDKAALLSQGLLKQLVETQGQAAAREVYGKTARRGALVSTLGNYGRTRAQLTKQLVSEQTATAKRMEKTYSSLKIANDRAIASIANAPAMEVMPTMPYTDFTPSPLEQGLKIAQSGISAGLAGWDLTPKGDTFFGITKPA